MHLLSCGVKCTVTDSPFNTQASCQKCPPSACTHFLTGVTRELVTLWIAAVLLLLLAELRIHWSSSFSRGHLRTCVAGWNFAVGLVLTPI